MQADLGARRVAIDSLALENPALDLARDARGQWNVLAMLKPARRRRRSASRCRRWR
ncbi:hypothetical protein [Rubrivivax gelatinosus]|uniref:hypothetical protein n=1 Tax=Rubrivivax gelatinosus TaxID=28068 RepID=UPI0003158305|nr:hypothetical protein [Rubrivivax gelatinosus]